MASGANELSRSRVCLRLKRGSAPPPMIGQARCAPLLSLKKTLRVDVDLELDVALAPGRAGEPFPQIGRKIEATR